MEFLSACAKPTSKQMSRQSLVRHKADDPLVRPSRSGSRLPKASRRRRSFGVSLLSSSRQFSLVSRMCKRLALNIKIEKVRRRKLLVVIFLGLCKPLRSSTRL